VKYFPQPQQTKANNHQQQTKGAHFKPLSNNLKWVLKFKKLNKKKKPNDSLS